MAQEQLKKAVALMKQGEKKEAAQVVQSVLREDRNNVQAWWVMANVLDDAEKKRKAVEKVLSLDANHKGARKFMASLPDNAVADFPPPPQPVNPKQEAESDMDWSKLDQKDAKAKTSDESSDDKAIKMATYLIVLFVLILIAGGIFFVAVPAYQDSQKSTAITASMNNFMTAMVAGDFETAETYVCEQYHMDQGRENNFARGLRPIYADLQVDFSELEIEVNDIESTTATANLLGEVTFVPAEGEAQTITIDSLMGVDGFAYERTAFRFILENEQWRICDNSFSSE